MSDKYQWIGSLFRKYRHYCGETDTAHEDDSCYSPYHLEQLEKDLQEHIESMLVGARIDELQHVDRHNTYYLDGSEPIEVQRRISQLQESKNSKEKKK